MLHNYFEFTQHIPYAIVNIIVSAIILQLVMRRRQDVRGWQLFVTLMVFMIIRAAVTIPTFANDNIENLLFWQNVQWPINGFLAMLWVTFSLQYSGVARKITIQTLLLMAIVPVFTGITIWFDGQLGWFRTSYEAIVRQGLPELSAESGFLTILHTNYTYALIILGMIVIFQYLFASPGIYRQQAIAVVVSVGVVLCVYFLQVGRNIHPALLPQIAIMIVQLIIIVGILRSGFFQFYPASRSLLMLAIRDGFVLLDHYNRITDINDAGEQITDRSKASVIGANIADVLVHMPEILSLVNESDTLTDEITIQQVIDTEVYNVSLLKIQNRGAVSRCLMWRNITVEQQAQQERIQKLEYQARMFALTEFVAMASHDLYQPLSSIKTRLYILEKSLEGTENLRHVIALKSRIEKIQSMLQDMFMLMRLEGQDEITKSRVGWLHFVESIETKYSDKLCIRSVSLDISKEQILLPCNETLLMSAITRLLDNALEHNDTLTQILLHVFEKDNSIVIEVSDNGEGITEQQIVKVLEPFYRANTARTVSESGSGLGLALVQQVARLHGGKIEIDSKIDIGTTVKLYIQPTL